MKLLLDQGLPRSAADHLRGAGLDVVHTGEIGLATADDATILDRGRAEDRVVVTLDADFHRFMALAASDRPSVIRIRIQGRDGAEIAHLVIAVLGACADDLALGALVSVQEHGIRVRRLPLGGRGPA